MWTKIGTIKQLDPTNKLVNAFLKFSKNEPLPVGVDGQMAAENTQNVKFALRVKSSCSVFIVVATTVFL
jgi:hypothetical protein